MFKLLSCVVLVNSLFYVRTVDIGNIFQVCDRDDMDVDDCLKESIQSAIKTIDRGVPALKLIPLDPYTQQNLVIQYNQNQISGKATLTDLKSYGFSKAIVTAVRSNIQNDSFELEIDMTNKRIEFEGTLEGYGQLNALTFSARGYFNNSMTDVVWTWKLTGRPEVRKGKTYMRIVKFFMRPDVGNMVVHIPNIFGNDSALNKLAYNFVNIYWRTIYNELLPIVEQIWEKIGIAYANQIFLRIPYNELFPSSEN